MEFEQFIVGGKKKAVATSSALNLNIAALKLSETRQFKVSSRKLLTVLIKKRTVYCGGLCLWKMTCQSTRFI